MRQGLEESLESAALINQLQERLTGSWMAQALYAAAELRIADLLALAPRTSDELAAATGSHGPSLRRLLQALTSIGICRERDDGAFEVTDLGLLLSENHPSSLKSWVIWWGHHLWQVWGNLLYSVKTGESARKLLNGTEGFGHLDQDPQSAAVFYGVTVELTRLTAEAVVQAYDFSRVEHIVDVGGGYGEMLASILTVSPSASGILFDRTSAIEGARVHFGKNHPALKGRCGFVSGDFFSSVPPGGDCYLLKSVIHDWNNDRSLKILDNCRRAMGKKARLLLIEPILPERREASRLHQTLSRHDLTMLVACGAQERTEKEFKELLDLAGFKISRILPAGELFKVIEAFPLEPLA